MQIHLYVAMAFNNFGSCYNNNMRKNFYYNNMINPQDKG